MDALYSNSSVGRLDRGVRGRTRLHQPDQCENHRGDHHPSNHGRVSPQDSALTLCCRTSRLRSLRVNAWMLVGPSGRGETTAARVLAGLHPPTAGRVLLDGRPLAGTTRRRARKQAAIGYVFQDAKTAFAPCRTVWEQIVRGPLRLRGATDWEAAAAARTALEQVRLDEQITWERPAALSGGEAQRAAIARALAAAPSVLICDEVTTGPRPRRTAARARHPGKPHTSPRPFPTRHQPRRRCRGHARR
ncbi:ABC transporter [Rhodococcus jostii]|uniref:ABC transporter n=1 Tax=Rhodococcus jostii TaxID=132919 RepID=A0A1H4IR42_RHOJO|nr:ABC transporter [Rhodococcus jostii]